MNRRSMVAGMCVMGLAAVITGCGSTGQSSGTSGGGNNTANNSSSNSSQSTSQNNSKSSSGSQAITLGWWTQSIRTKETLQAISTFEKQNSSIKITPEYAQWSGYWTKLATEYAGGDPPDVVQQSTGYLVDYVNKKKMLPLTNLSEIDLSGLDKNALASGKVNGTLYAIPAGINALDWVANPTLLKKSGLTFDSSAQNYTWADFAKLCEQLHQKLPSVYGVSNNVASEDFLMYYAREHGEHLFDPSGKSMGISTQTLTDWLTYWLDLQQKGGTPPAQVTSTTMNASLPQTPFIKGQTVFQGAWTGEGADIAKLLNQAIDRELLPDWGSSNKPYAMHPDMYWSISSTTKHPHAAAKLLNFLVNSPQVAKTFVFERGVPINQSNLKLLSSSETSSDKKEVAFLNQVSKVASPQAPASPAYGQFGTQLATISQEVLFQKISPSKAAQELISQGNQDLANNG